MKQRVQQIRNHVRHHRRAYLGFGGFVLGVVAGASIGQIVAENTDPNHPVLENNRRLWQMHDGNGNPLDRGM